MSIFRRSGDGLSRVNSVATNPPNQACPLRMLRASRHQEYRSDTKVVGIHCLFTFEQCRGVRYRPPSDSSHGGAVRSAVVARSRHPALTSASTAGCHGRIGPQFLSFRECVYQAVATPCWSGRHGAEF